MEVGTLYHGQAGDAVFVDTPNAPFLSAALSPGKCSVPVTLDSAGIPSPEPPECGDDAGTPRASAHRLLPDTDWCFHLGALRSG